MKTSRRRPSLILVLAGVLLVLVPLLAYLQYEWIGRVSEGDRDRMQASLRRASNQFAEDFDRQIAEVFSAFQVAPLQPRSALLTEYAGLYARWKQRARYSRLVSDIYIADTF